MVSATDVITYVGVPLAVLGVMPILYTFISALYTRKYIRHVLHKNNLEAQVRARLMTGVVEVDLPVFELEPLPRDEPRYWTQPELPMSIEGASWSHFNWFTREIGCICFRFQRSDRVRLPESKIEFEKLVVFLLDRGASPCLKGFYALRNRGQQTTVGTALMEVMLDFQATAIPVLTVAKPGDRHDSISLRLHWSNGLGKRDNSSLPLFWIRIPALRPAADNTQSDLNAPANNNLSIQEQDFYVHIGVNGVENIRPKAKIASDAYAELHPDHLKLFKLADTHWDAWLACAAVAVFGFKEKSIFRFKPSSKVLFFGREGEILVCAAYYLGLVDRLNKKGESSLPSMYSQEDIQPTDDFGQRILIQLQEHTEKPPRDRISHKELWKLSKWSAAKAQGKVRSNVVMRFKECPDVPGLMSKYISMPELLKLCLLFLGSHPVTLGSHPVISLPSKHWEVDWFSQKAAEAIICAMILDHDFAKTIYSELDNVMAIFLGKREIIWEQSGSFLERSDVKRSGNFCCAIVLLALIGKRAAYLLSGEDIESCEREWRLVYLS